MVQLSVLVKLLKDLFGSRRTVAEPKASDSRVVEGSQSALRNQGKYPNQGRSAKVEASGGEAMRIEPDYAEVHCSLGGMLIDEGRLAEAEVSYREAIRLKPELVVAHCNLGVVLQNQGRLAEAEASFREAVRLHPDLAEVHNNLGTVLHGLGRFVEAEACFQEAIRLMPNLAEAYGNLGAVLADEGRISEAEARYREAIRLKPDYAEAHNNLGNILTDQGRLAEAEASCREAIRLKPDLAEAHNNLGNTLRNQPGRIAEAEASCRKAVWLNPDLAVAHNNLGKTLKDQGRLPEAEASYREAIRLNPDYAEAHSNLLLAMLYSSHKPEQIWLEHQAFASKFEAPLKTSWPRHSNLPDPNRRLKIGYVSGDFRDNHPVAFFIEPILAKRDKQSFEIFAYHNHAIHDLGTKRIAASVDNWFDCAGIDDVTLARRIQDDGIDILVDLSGHTNHNRMLVFARKPAPLQVTWIGYPGTTGLEAMNFRFTSESLDPLGVTEKYHSEQLIRLPESATYQPFAEAPEVTKLPALENDKLVLACLNNPTKINLEVIALWARILNGIPHAQLMFGNAGDSVVRNWLVSEFAKAGIDERRLILQPRLPMKDYLALHQQIDLALDPFPYNGGTTSMHSLWMGVPFVTLSGDTTQSRVGVSVLRQVGLESFIADSKEEYFELVLYWSQQLLQLSQIRNSLRDRIKSVEQRPDAIVAHLENAYRRIWCQWCELREMRGNS